MEGIITLLFVYGGCIIGGMISVLIHICLKKKYFADKSPQKKKWAFRRRKCETLQVGISPSKKQTRDTKGIKNKKPRCGGKNRGGLPRLFVLDGRRGVLCCP